MQTVIRNRNEYLFKTIMKTLNHHESWGLDALWRAIPGSQTGFACVVVHAGAGRGAGRGPGDLASSGLLTRVKRHSLRGGECVQR